MDMSPPGASPLESLAILLPSYMASVFIEAMLFGVYAVLFFMGAWSLLHLSHLAKPSKRDLVILSVNTIMFLLTLSHIILSVVVTQYRTLDAISDGLYNASNMTSRIGAARFCIYVTQTLICDAFMIYRAFVIWERQWTITVLPTILLLLDAVSGYISTTSAGDDLSLMIIFPCTSFLTNSVSTALIMWRVLSGADGLQRTRFTMYRKVLGAIVQSAAVYSTASITLLVVVIVSPESAYATCLTFFSPFIGLIFSSVILRLAQRSAARSAPSGSESRPHWVECGRDGPVTSSMTERVRSPHGFQGASIHLPALHAYGDTDVEAQTLNASVGVLEKDFKSADAAKRETCNREASGSPVPSKVESVTGDTE
ncbi:hypothetical protein BC628DRAFT_845695 [Trametes gibbosa]|nr:hypothetical protein BC628DRAFT_845695 [Trametes gibbosa]